MNSEKRNYFVAGSSYLERARKQLTQNEPEALFYAAFELRCCVEARQEEYLKALGQFDNKKIRPWKIGETRDRIEKISNGKVISRVTIHFADGQKLAVFHTPVSTDLTEKVERFFGDILHRQPDIREIDGEWWVETRSKVRSVYRDAWLACQGNSPAPPFWNPHTGEAHRMIVEARNKEENRLVKKLANSVGEQLNFQVNYLNKPPVDWVCDI